MQRDVIYVQLLRVLDQKEGVGSSLLLNSLLIMNNQTLDISAFRNHRLNDKIEGMRVSNPISSCISTASVT